MVILVERLSHFLLWLIWVYGSKKQQQQLKMKPIHINLRSIMSYLGQSLQQSLHHCRFSFVFMRRFVFRIFGRICIHYQFMKPLLHMDYNNFLFNFIVMSKCSQRLFFINCNKSNYNYQLYLLMSHKKKLMYMYELWRMCCWRTSIDHHHNVVETYIFSSFFLFSSSSSCFKW